MWSCLIFFLSPDVTNLNLFLLMYDRCVWYSGALWNTSQCVPHQTGCHRPCRIQYPDTVEGR